MDHVKESFLETPIPFDRRRLTEQRQAANVHAKVLNAHQNLLQTRFWNQSAEMDKDELVELAKMQNDVLRQVTLKSEAIEKRLVAWEDYGRSQDDLFTWLRSVERKRTALDLRHINSRIPANIPRLLVEIKVRRFYLSFLSHNSKD